MSATESWTKTYKVVMEDEFTAYVDATDESEAGRMVASRRKATLQGMDLSQVRKGTTVAYVEPVAKNTK